MAMPCRTEESSPGDSICSASAYHICAVFSIAKIHRLWNQEMEMGVISLTVNPSDPLVTFLFSVFLPLCSSILEVLVPERGMPPLEDTKIIPLNCNIRIVTQPLRAPHVFK